MSELPQVLKDFVSLKWEKPKKYWYDGTELIALLKLDSGKFEVYNLSVKCDGDYFDLECNYEHFDAWSIDDFDLVHIVSGGMMDKLEE